jgi:hypothetical protein
MFHCDKYGIKHFLCEWYKRNPKSDLSFTFDLEINFLVFSFGD